MSEISSATTRATPEQERAIRLADRALVVEAGAGTGKTWVLVQRFITLLANNPDWSLDSIVAVTFTEKAAREMRGRIREAIEAQARASGADSPWAARRRELDRLLVSTIHGLCARILRENAIAAAIDPRFNVLDEEEATFLKEEAIQLTLVSLAETDSPAMELLSSLLVTDLRAEMANLLNRRGVVQQLFSELPPPEELLAHWASGLATMQAALVTEHATNNEAFQTALAELPLLPAPADLNDKLFPAYSAGQAGVRAWQAGDTSGAVELWAGIRLVGGRAANWGGPEPFREFKGLLTTLREAAKKLLDNGFGLRIDESDEAAAQMLARWQRLWQALDEQYGALKAARGALDFDDLELEAVRLLEEKPRHPRLRAFLERSQHLMVDEYQDSNPLQKRIVYALAHPREPGRLFVVGDAKQSIYRFRQAQVSIFNETTIDISRHHEDARLKLSRSFRSHDALVKGVNSLFDQILQPLAAEFEPYEATPGPLVAHRPLPPHLTKQPAAIELHLLPLKVDEQTINAADARSWEARRLAARLHQLKRERFPVWDRDHYRPFAYGDAAILFRATTTLPLYEAQFQAAGLPYLTVGGRGYYDRPEIQDLLALLAALYNPRDDLHLATTLRSPLFSLSDETLYRLRWRDAADQSQASPPPLIEALAAPPPTAQPEAIAHAHVVLAGLLGLARRVDVWQLLRAALDRTGYEATLILADRSGGGGGRRYQNVQKFLGLARDRGEADLAQFLRRIQLLKAREAREGEAAAGAGATGAVQLMSIHAAKGLEFPVVAVADLGRGNQRPRGARILHDPAFGLVCQRRDDDGEWQKPAGFQWAEWLNGQMEQAESKRLLYVACTRAADRLILSGRLGTRGSWLTDICAAWEIEGAGDDYELVAEEGFALELYRPERPPADLFAPVSPEPAAAPDAADQSSERPPLMRPLPPLPRSRPQAVTDLSAAAEARTPSLYRVTGATTAWQNNRVGRLVHRALADWACLALPAADLQRALARFDGEWRGGADRERHIAAAHKLLSDFSRSPTYRQINAAPTRLHELPFHLPTDVGPLQGIIDLLYQSEAGEWLLVDWKTEWLKGGDLSAAAAAHLPQLAIYWWAASQLLNAPVTAALCFVRYDSTIQTLPQETLQKTVAALGLGR